ncbi:MAG: hypothetical protein JNK30_05480 [Phenylobacterium sp.]|uniref:DUF5961 family protein n=1 Tax=Phenylobacterium sp. TaxID=1871053 RepID=UPI001A3D7849|nr:DUF5961 family protein [Phenylobacterium sp.]MBL8770814.1 hypothetical protein [Phenylobacterium sp.]
MSDTNLQRRFCIHGVSEAPSRAHLVEGLNFEDAALRFIEDHHPAPDDDDNLSLFVEDMETGQRQCFTIDLGSGEATPCD